jgi:hypothetical protein
MSWIFSHRKVKYLLELRLKVFVIGYRQTDRHTLDCYDCQIGTYIYNHITIVFFRGEKPLSG